MTEREWDKKLNIQTAGREDAHEDTNHYPYEPTPYCVLERLAESGYLSREKRLLDYGCGKGRVGFFLHHVVGCSVTGIEFEPGLYGKALQNRRSAGEPKGVSFVCEDAAHYAVGDADAFYFFNPFSVTILRSVLGQILQAYYEEPGEKTLFFYYPNAETVAWLMTVPELCFVDEVDCQDMFPTGSEREQILIFKLGNLW